jgi:hypothetical protein
MSRRQKEKMIRKIKKNNIKKPQPLLLRHNIILPNH